MNLKIKRIIYAVLIFLTCIIIFNFSSQNSEKSSETSGVIVDRVVNTISTVNKKAKKENLKEKVTFLVRKSAHFSIYTLLGIWLMCFANTYEISLRKKFLICILIGTSYAISDEIHQFYIGGRSCEIRDICIDSCGVLFGNAITMAVKKINTKIKKQ